MTTAANVHNDYELLHIIGKGSYGSVYAARPRRPGWQHVIAGGRQSRWRAAAQRACGNAGTVATVRGRREGALEAQDGGRRASG